MPPARALEAITRVRGDSHLAIGVATWLGFWASPARLEWLPSTAASGVGELTILTAFAGVASLLPDLDHPKAALAQLRFGNRRGGLEGVRPLAPIAWGIGLGFGHRGLLHSLLAVALVVWLGARFLTPAAAVALGWGYAAHILADAMTKRGVPLFLPLTQLKFGLPGLLAIRTGSLGELLYAGVIVGGAVLYAVSRLG